jgi:triosephosphate isomerase (TIM)
MVRPEVVIAPPSLYLLLVREHLRPGLEVASQNVFDKPNGAFTGEISVSQLTDSGITWTILGHSERRTILGETDAVVASKTKVASTSGVGVIWCCGESLEQREAGKTIEVVSKQLEALAAEISDWSKIVIAYEPIWAIGTGKVASTQQAQEVHAAIRAWLKKEVSEKAAEETRILYGGSVTEKNCGELSKEPDIDGFLVGGASLKPACEYHNSIFYLAVLRIGSRRHYQLQAVSSQGFRNFNIGWRYGRLSRGHRIVGWPGTVDDIAPYTPKL